MPVKPVYSPPVVSIEPAVVLPVPEAAEPVKDPEETKPPVLDPVVPESTPAVESADPVVDPVPPETAKPRTRTKRTERTSES